MCDAGLVFYVRAAYGEVANASNAGVCEGLSVQHGWVLSLVFTQGQAELFP